MTVKDQPGRNRTAELEKELAEKIAELRLKERELQIESSLEKVRAIALSMKQPSDMLEICKTISSQLESLGLKEIRNVQTAIFHEEKGVYFNYEYYAKHDKTVFTETNYKDHPVSTEFAERMLKGAGEFFTHGFNKKELKDWIRYQKGTNVFIDSFLETAPSLNYYWFSLGPVALGMSTYVALSETEIELFKRFIKVFELSYRRYLDIEQAHVQAKEAKLQASLEKVRAQAMAMHTTQELKNVGEIIYHELKSLGFTDIRNTEIIINNDEKETVLSHYCDYGITGTIEVDYKINPILKKWAEEMKSASDAFVSVTISEKEIDDWRKFREEIGYPPDPKLNAASSVYYYSYSTGLGALSVSSFTSLNDDQKKTLERFRNVFTLAYRRYVDVALAEAQARESQVQLALERVRARSLAMQRSTELHEVAEVLFKQLLNFGGNILNAGIVLCKPDADEDEYWISSDSGIRPVISIPHTEDPVQKKLYEGWKNKLDFYSESKGGDELKAHYKYMVSVPALKPYFDEGGSNRSFPTWQKWHAAYFSHGYLFLLTADEYDEEKILVRFAKIFEQAYTRFLDLKKAEAQAREAQVELALERVRARTMAMQKSDEFSETSYVLFQQFNELGVNAEQISIALIYDEDKTVEIFATYHGSKLERQYRVKIDVQPVISRIYNNFKSGAKSAVVDVHGKELRDYNNWRNQIRHTTTYNEAVTEDDHWIISMASFSHGVLSFSSGKNVTDENLKLLERFAAVFNLTYTRFLDLQKAEAQAREAQIEASLERVRGKAMAMHNSNDLTDAAGTVFTELNKLGINPIRSGFVLLTKDSRRAKLYPATSFDKSITLSFNGEFEFVGHPVYEKQYESWQKRENYFPVLEGDVLTSYYEILSHALSVPLENFPTDKKQFGSFLPFTGGFLFTWSTEPYSEKEINILERFKSILDLTIRRYSDLQNAEAQAREAIIQTSLERVRASAMAMHKSEDLPDICEVMYKEFRSLGFSEMRNAIINIHNDADNSFINYDYADAPGKSTNRFSNNVLPFVQKIITASQRTNDAFSESFITGNELAEFKKLREQSGQKQDTKLDNAKNLFFYFYSIGIGSIGISTYTAITDEQRELLKRFRNVFNLSYQRYVDISKAEAQTRESQIALALERVRARTLAMLRSDELFEVTELVFQQFQSLTNFTSQSSIAIINEEQGSAELFTTMQGKVVPIPVTANLSEPYFMSKMYEAWKAGKKIIVVTVAGEDLNRYNEWRNSLGRFTPEALEEKLSVSKHKEWLNVLLANKKIFRTDHTANDKWIVHAGLFSHGMISFSTTEPVPEETIQIIERFAAVFDLTYTRFLDLKNAEAQTREAHIQAGLERVRSRTLAMQSSDELAETAAVLFKQVILLGIEPNRLYICIIKDESGECEFWITDEDGSKVSSAFTVNLNDNPTFLKMFNGWKEKVKSISIDMQGEELHEYFEQLQKLHVPFKGGLAQNRRVQNIAYFSQGLIGLASPEPQPEETVQLLERFAYVFNLTFARFHDLQIAEAHAKQALIEEQKLREEKKRADALLLNILPEEIANELKQFGKSYARKHDEVTILFADIKGFSSIAETLSAQELVTQLDECFRAFDHIVDKHGLEKIKTVGDAYVCACGLPNPVADHAVKAVRAAIDMRNFIQGFSITRTIQDLPAFDFRIGVNTGSVVTGVVGLKKFTYDIWGDAVNMAARMEQHGEAGKINISGSTYALIRDKFTCTPRGKIPAKNKGEVEMYFVE